MCVCVYRCASVCMWVCGTAQQVTNISSHHTMRERWVCTQCTFIHIYFSGARSHAGTLSAGASTKMCTLTHHLYMLTYIYLFTCVSVFGCRACVRVCVVVCTHIHGSVCRVYACCLLFSLFFVRVLTRCVSFSSFSFARFLCMLCCAVCVLSFSECEYLKDIFFECSYE